MDNEIIREFVKDLYGHFAELVEDSEVYEAIAEALNRTFEGLGLRTEYRISPDGEIEDRLQ
tara:strand:+ start:539 stop:721 length:183 start_codon:yes stop_codon:yes gene_type:complete